jgi:hypothetical protein
MNTPVAPRQFVDASVERLNGLRDPGIGEILGRWAEEQPEAIAFLHKRRGRWHAFPRSSVVREVRRLSAILKVRPGADRIHLAASGLYEPDLIILALAALSVSGEVFLLPGNLRGEMLSQKFDAIGPTHGFVQGRRTIAQWFKSAPSGSVRLPLFSAQAFVGGNSVWDVVPLQDPATPVARPARSAWSWRAPRFADTAWIDEGTEWPDGLRRVIDSVLHDGLVIAFPETAESTIRDRRQIQPAALILSPARQRRLAEEDRARRAAEGSWSRRLADRAEAAPGGPFARFVNHRRNTLLGLSRVRPLALAEQTPAPDPA